MWNSQKRQRGGEKKEREKEKREKVLRMTHPLRLPLRYAAKKVGYLQQAETAALFPEMII